MAGRRIINLNGGTYNKEVRGNSVNIQATQLKPGETLGHHVRRIKPKNLET
jgi:hypothetical protein